MTLQERLIPLRRIFHRYWSGRVLAAWLVLTVLTVVYVYEEVVVGVFDLTPYVYKIVAVELGGIALAIWSRRPLYALLGTFFFGITVLQDPGRCLSACIGGEERLIIFFKFWTGYGPSIIVHNYKFCCDTHAIKLIPFTIGYLLIGEAIITANRNAR